MNVHSITNKACVCASLCVRSRPSSGPGGQDDWRQLWRSPSSYQLARSHGYNVIFTNGPKQPTTEAEWTTLCSCLSADYIALLTIPITLHHLSASLSFFPMLGRIYLRLYASRSKRVKKGKMLKWIQKWFCPLSGLWRTNLVSINGVVSSRRESTRHPLHL